MVTGPELLIVIVLALGYVMVDTVKKPIKETGRVICHVATLGHKCDKPEVKK